LMGGAKGGGQESRAAGRSCLHDGVSM
jgi:hypothetical protein